MRPPLLLLAAVLGPAVPALAQVTVDLHALDALPNARPAASRPLEPAVPRPRPKGQLASVTPEHAPASGTTVAKAAPPTVAAPANAPPDVSLPTGAPPPPTLEANAAPPPPPTSSDSGTGAPMTAAAVRIAFDAAQSDLNASGSEVIKQLVSAAPKGDNTTFNVVAYAAATPDDPSTARRLSLSRALAVRTALMADGVPSSRIYVRALGGQGGEGPPDRADVSVLGTNSTSSPPGKPTP
jgi:outer membrane protein OmpA-like peptidoglycan-associated protein